MNKTDTHAFVNQLLIYTLVMICFSGSIGLGTVWLRQQMAQTATRVKQLESRAVETERRAAEFTRLIASEQSPEMLNRRNLQWRLGLVQPLDTQVVRIDENPERRLAAKRNLELFSSEPAVLPAHFLAGGTR
jgi:hypothetical protein